MAPIYYPSLFDGGDGNGGKHDVSNTSKLELNLMKRNPGYIKQCKTNARTRGVYILRWIINTHESLENNQRKIEEHKQEKTN